MPIQPNELQIGAIYITPPKKGSSRQLRRIDDIKDGRVHYSSSGENAPHAWRRGHNLTNPPLIATFCKDVASVHLAAPSQKK